MVGCSRFHAQQADSSQALHYARLASRLQKPAQLIAAAPCTHSPEGTGWGAVNAHAGLLWYAEALGVVAATGTAECVKGHAESESPASEPSYSRRAKV